MHDARQLDHYPSGSHRVEAQNPWVWIHHKGAWRKGAIHCWYVHGDTWMAWMQHEDPAPDVPWAQWGLYQRDRPPAAPGARWGLTPYEGTTTPPRPSPAARALVELPDESRGRFT